MSQQDTAGQPEIEDRRQKLKLLGPKAKKEPEHVEKKWKEAGEQPVLERREHTEADERATREACDAVDRERMPSRLGDPRGAERAGEEELQLQKEQPRLRKLRFGEDSGAAALVPALATAQYIEDIDRITYPEGIKRPEVELNVNAQKGKFRYDRDFLLQFTSICKEKPDNLPPLDALGIKPRDTPHTRRGSGPTNHASNNMTISGNVRPVSMDSIGASSHGNTTRTRTGRDRTRSKRGANANRTKVMNNADPTSPNPVTDLPVELVAPLEESTSRWEATIARSNGSGLDKEPPGAVEREVNALLNELTMERLDSILNQLIAWANKSEKEKDCRTLTRVTELIFEKATDEARFSEMYARLCHKMMEKISPRVQDDRIKNSEGKPFAGGQLFRKYLFSRCQEEFERGWVTKETTTTPATKITEDHASGKAHERTKGGEEYELYSEEYYAVANAKRRRVGLIRFIGELFKLQMLTERIIHEHIKKLLANAQAENEEIEGLCELLTTVGSLLDTPKARGHFNVYFSRIRELTKNSDIDRRMAFMLQDVIELRERKWIPHSVIAVPATVAQVPEA